MLIGEVQAVRGRTLSLDPSTGTAARRRRVHGQRHRGRSLVTAKTALLGMAGGTPAGFPPGRLPVPEDEGWILVTRRRAKLRPVSQGPSIRLQRLDGGYLRRVDVALGAEVARVAGSTGGRNAAVAHARLVAVSLLVEAGSPVRGRGGEAAHGW